MYASRPRPSTPSISREFVGLVVSLEVHDGVQVNDDHTISMWVQGARFDTAEVVDQVVLGRAAEKLRMHEIDLDDTGPTRAALDAAGLHGARPPFIPEFVDHARDLDRRVVGQPNDLDAQDQRDPAQPIARGACHRQVGRSHVLPPHLGVHDRRSDRRDRAEP
ncbi:hypothetical protein ABZT49_13805 [Methylobacterium sp. EM32]